MQRPCGRNLARMENKKEKEDVGREHRTKSESPWRGGGVDAQGLATQVRILFHLQWKPTQGVYKRAL